MCNFGANTVRNTSTTSTPSSTTSIWSNIRVYLTKKKVERTYRARNIWEAVRMAIKEDNE